MDEQSIIAAAADLPRVGGGIVIGIGDDAAVVRPAVGYEVLTMDTLVDGVHFTQAWASPADVGWKTLAVSVSDLAAMGAEPRHALLGLTLPDTLTETWTTGFFAGLAEACQVWRVPVIGGDTVRGPALVITLTLTGEARQPLLRTGAEAGWLLAVTGNLGGAAAGLHALQTGKTAPAAALTRWRRPPARLEAGRALAALDRRIACTDCSDGLVIAAGLLAGDLGLELDADKLPIDPAAMALADDQNQAIDWALVGGEDYELVLAFPAASEAEARAAVAPLPLTVVGRLLPEAGRWLFRGGRRQGLPAHWGFRHF
ncbi:MAG: thiamine-phosphate kinase [Candidatus Sericytochromatia bacterium]|nr:thiamine-phosphate kinase [Candidatus Sericytochromatia bacterium]